MIRVPLGHRSGALPASVRSHYGDTVRAIGALRTTSCACRSCGPRSVGRSIGSANSEHAPLAATCERRLAGHRARKRSSGWRQISMREQVDTDHENSLIELFSATAWMIATVLFARRFVITWKAGGNEWVCRWILCFALLSLVAFGEEISWGTHWTGPDRFSDFVNSQWSIHNQSIGSLKLVHYTNLAFYAGMLFLWVALPVMKDRPPLRRWTAFVSMPIPSRMTRQFFVVNTITYLVLDRIFNVGHVYEASTGVVAILVAITMRDDDGRDAHPT